MRIFTKKRIALRMLVLSVIGFTRFSCGESPSEEQLKYEEELRQVMDEHDELMKDMSLLNRLIRQVDEKSEGQDTADYNRVKEHLKSAHKAMFDWMHDFNEEFPDINKEKDSVFTGEEYKIRLKKLSRQQEILEKVENDFEQSIGEAEKLLKEN